MLIMEYTEIDLEAYPRKAHFEYFRNMAYPYAGVTVHVDITNLHRTVRERKLPFFLTCLYLAANAANGVPELRRRIRGDGMIEYKNCKTSHTVALENGTYCYCSLDCSMPFESFVTYAVEKQNAAREHPSMDDGAEADSLFFVSSLPWLSYSALVQPTPTPPDSNPRITFGRYYPQDSRMVMPVSLLVHHGLADGKHIADFYRKFETACRQPFL